MPAAERRTHRLFARVGPLFALLFAVACGGEALDGYNADDQELSGTRLRVMGGNLSSGTRQSYAGPGDRIFAGLKPDIALVQEFNVGANSQAELDQFVHTTFGASYTYYREPSSTYQIPNGVVSRFPIVASGSIADPKVDNRAFAWAKVRLPDGRFLWAYSLHLLTSGDRNAEATALVGAIKATVPAGDFVVIGGDLNTRSRTEACLGTLSQIVVTSGPYPADGAGNQNTNSSRSKAYDWLIVDPALLATEVPVSIGASTFPRGLVVDTRVYTPIADLAPALAGDSGASSMQHMGVVRDFLLQDTVPPPPPAPGDAFEPDDTPALAKPIALNVAQRHDLDPATDADWVTFTLSAKTNVRIRTSGPAGGDTYLLFTDAQGTRQLGANDDGGPGLYSLLQRTNLAAGTYAVRITSKNAASTITGYTLRVSTF